MALKMALKTKEEREMTNEKHTYTDDDADSAKKNGTVSEHVPNEDVGQILSDRLRADMDRALRGASSLCSFITL